MAHSTPVSLNERADILDVLRGFAILGIFLNNIFGFTGYNFVQQSFRESLPTWPADGILSLLQTILVEGKFYSLFSLLFGIGFSIILVRNKQKGINPLGIFYRRLAILLLIGAFHLFLLWEGDILFLYALIGMLLPLFMNCKDRTLLIWAAILILSPILIDLFKVLFQFRTGNFLVETAQRVDRGTGLPVDDSFASYLFKEGSGWAEWRNWQASGFFYRYGYIIESNRIPKVLGMFILGLYAGRKMIYQRLEEYSSLFKKLRLYGFAIGLPASVAMAIFEFDHKDIPSPYGLLDSFFYALGVVPLCLAYVATICLFWVKTKGQNRWRSLAPAGRMALTNYLMQTLISIFLFYGVGLGLGGNIGPSVFLPAVLLIFSLQVVYSNWWFRYFNYGPVEWAWRQLTYGKRLPLRKK